MGTTTGKSLKFFAVCMLSLLSLSTLYAQDFQFPVIRDRLVKIMPFGNSLTSAIGGESSYRYWLWQQLVSAGFDSTKIDFVGSFYGVGEDGTPLHPDFDWDHEGHRGHSSDDLFYDLPFLLDVNVPDIVLMHVGTNDINYGFPDPHERARPFVKGMIDIFRADNPNVVILLAQIVPSDIYTSRYPIFNQMIAEVAAEKTMPNSPILVVDQFTGYEPRLDHKDGVHPRESGEKKMSQRWFEQLCPVLIEMAGKPIEIMPGSGSFLRTQNFDLGFLVRSTTPVLNAAVALNGAPVFLTKFAKGRLASGDPGQTFVKSGISCRDIGPGTHTLTVQAVLQNGTTVRDTVQWHIENNQNIW